jgi:non-homologous end joining protein Ku
VESLRGASGSSVLKGFLRLSLVSIGVEVYSAITEESQISFNQIHKPSGKRVNYTKSESALELDPIRNGSERIDSER